jgi:hypothetical protein
MTIHTRGANRPVVLARQGEPFLEFVDVSGDVRFSSYMGERCGPTGASEWSLTICKEATKSTSPACHRAATEPVRALSWYVESGLLAVLKLTVARILIHRPFNVGAGKVDVMSPLRSTRWFDYRNRGKTCYYPPRSRSDTYPRETIGAFTGGHQGPKFLVRRSDRCQA